MKGDAAPAEAPLVVNGWSVYAHPVFLDQLEGLIGEVEARKARDPRTWQKKNCTKRLAAIFKLVSEVIPADPGAPQFRQGGTLGDGRKHWFRAKFFQQYRLFFRFDSTARIVVLAWVNRRSDPQGLWQQERCLSCLQGNAGQWPPTRRFRGPRERSPGSGGTV